MGRLALFSVFLGCVISCTINDDNRCGDDMMYQDETCVPIPDTESNTGEDLDTGYDGGNGTDEADYPTGVGQPCDNSEECASFDADYCAKDPRKPGEKGRCAISNCTLEPNNCPPSTDFICCRILETMPNLCIPAEEVEKLKDIGIDCK